MGFRINTNIAALNAHTNATMNNRNLDDALSKLSSGLRINKAADDASGMAIADSLRTQANSLGQAISNANDAIGIVQTADKAMDEQVKILDTIKTKAIQSASDSQTASSREALQKDINRLIEQLDNIAKTTTFNGQTLLSGTFSNKEFQVGAFSNQTIKASISNTQSLAIGAVSQRADIGQLGNTTALGTAAVVGDTVLSVASLTGLAKGDTIRINGMGNVQITGVNLSNGSITLAAALTKAVSTGATIAVVSNVAEDLNKLGTISIATTSIAVTDATGFAVGDVLTFTSSTGMIDTFTVSGVNVSSGVLSGAYAGANITAGSVMGSANTTLTTRAVVGTAFAAADYAQYTVEGVKFEGVQMTDASGNGVAQSGLGRVADLINAASSSTGIKAVADTEVNSAIRIGAGALTADMTINGFTILAIGDSLVSGDSDNKLTNAINANTSKTGVSATLESDGTMTLKSDGRAMKLSGFTLLTGINDGVHVGTLELTKQGSGVIDVTSAHYSNAGLTSVSTGKTLTDVVSSSKLSDLIFGQVDDNKDGLVNSSDKIGLLRTRDGATKAMDIVESAITKLDSVRADLGSVQNQLVVTVNNISVTQVNVKAAESQIRDVDFAAESANFSKFNILAQSGSYAMSQANAVQQNVLRLLQ
ncbi:MAG: flagellin [Sulfuricurvum sp.]|jgi:flagellin